MNRPILAFALVAALLPCAAYAADPAPVPAPPAPPVTAPAAPAAHRVNGRITTYDAATKTVTVTNRNGDTLTFKVDDHTTYYQDVTASLADIKTGDTLRAFGRPSDDGKSISPRRVAILTAADMSDPPFGNFTPTIGVVAATTPNLTITTSDGKTVTLDLADEPRIVKSVAGTVADLTADRMVSAIVTGSDTDGVASKVHVTMASN